MHSPRVLPYKCVADQLPLAIVDNTLQYGKLCGVVVRHKKKQWRIWGHDSRHRVLFISMCLLSPLEIPK